MKRLFVGIELPTAVRNKIFKEILIHLRDVRRVDTNNLHITLAFIENADEGKAKEIKEKLTSLEFSPIQVHIGRTGHFNKRVFWVSAESEGLAKLAGEISAALRTPNEFRGHITLARARESTNFDEEFKRIEELSVDEIIDVKSFALFESTITKNGSTYAKLGEFTTRG